MLDMLTFLSSFSLSITDKLFMPCRKASFEPRFFKGQLPLALKAPEPFDLLWVHLGYSFWGTCWRRLVVWLICILLLAVSFIGIIFAKNLELQMQLKYNFDIDCGLSAYNKAQVEYQEAQKKLIGTSETPFNYLHCYCLQEYKLVGSAVSEVSFAGGEKYCDAWLGDFNMSASGYIWINAIVVMLINVFGF
jgi:hypothetical protein